MQHRGTIKEIFVHHKATKPNTKQHVQLALSHLADMELLNIIHCANCNATVGDNSERAWEVLVVQWGHRSYSLQRTQDIKKNVTQLGTGFMVLVLRHFMQVLQVWV